MIHLLIPVLAPYRGEFTLHRAMDPTTGKVAMRYFLPKGWKATDTVTWNPADTIRPSSISSTMSSPDGGMRIDILPNETFTFQTQNGQVQGNLPPETATKALNHVMTGQHASVQHANLIFRKDFDVPTPFDGQAGLTTKGDVGILNASFEENGMPVTEFLTVTEFVGSHQENDLTQGITVMTQGYTLTCKGSMPDEAFRTFALVLASNRPDPTFVATIMAVSKAQQNGTPDVKAISASVSSLSEDAKSSYLQNLSIHGASTAKVVPSTLYPGLSEVMTFDGPILTFKGVHVWMKKPDEYVISDAAASPGPGWEAAKAS